MTTMVLLGYIICAMFCVCAILCATEAALRRTREYWLADKIHLWCIICMICLGCALAFGVLYGY